MKKFYLMILAVVTFAGMLAISGCKKKETYTVTFNPNGGTGTMSAQTFTEGEAQALTRNAFTYDGYTFSGWNTVQGGSGASYTDGQTITATADMTLYAQWTSNGTNPTPGPTPTTVTITFDANGGTGEMEPQTFTIGTAQTLTANAFTKENNWFTGWNTAIDGQGTTYTDSQEITATENMTLYAQWKLSIGETNGHVWVDLGLPSGTKWATSNVGSTTPEGYGDYFAWGETTTKENYNCSTYRYCNGDYNTLTKYCNYADYGNNGITDALTILEASDDAATANWGAGWRMPTREEMNELYSNCTHEWTTQNGVNGRLFTGPNGNSIFLSAAGRRYDSSLLDVGSYGYYWSSSLYSGYPNDAWNLNFYSGYYYVRSHGRYYGQSVRPVCAQ